MKISTRFLTFVLAISFVSMCLLTTVSSILSSKTILAEKEKKLKESVAREAAYVDGWLKSQLALVSTLAVDLADQPDLEPGRMLPILKTHTNTNIDIFDVYFGVPSGIVTFSSGFQPPYEQGWASYKRPWYIAAMNDINKAVFTDLYIDVQTGYLCLTAAKAVIQKGEVIGVAASDMLIDKITKHVTNISVEDSESSFLTNKDGEVLILSNNLEYSGNSDGIFEHLSEIDGGLYKGVWEKTMNGGLISMETPELGNKIFVCSVIETNGWHLYSVVPMSSLMGPITNFITTLILISIATLMLTATIMIIMIKKSITRPIRHVTYAALELSKGNTDIFFQADISKELLDVDLNQELKKAGENLHSKNEIDIMFSALKNMLNQINGIQKFKLEAIEARHEKEKAEASARSKTDFLARVSHEIRTPMNAIIGMTELVLREELPKDACEHVLTIKHAGVNLLSIINDILDFSKIETGKLEIIPAKYTFSSLINDVISIIRMRVIDSRVRFAVNIDSHIPNNLFGDESRIRQIFLNLLTNAVKYTQKGAVCLSVDGDIKDETTITLTIKVMDTGKGIKEEDIGKLFGNFVQLDLINNKGIEGTGLGLAITKSLVQAMDGNINVFSEYGQGSTFTILLPQKYTSEEKLASVNNPDKKNVLVYERREVYAKSIMRSLDNLGVDCTHVSNEIELCEKLAVNKFSFIFISSTLFEKNKDIVLREMVNIKIVLLTEFGEAIVNRGLSILAMPVYVLSIANILNNVSDSFNYSSNEKNIMGFIAPEARVLIVDDIKTNLKIAEGLLQPYRMQVDLCTSGMGAIKAVESRIYDVVFMDYMMPELDGVETARRIRALDREDLYYKNLPIIALTANAVSGTEEMLLRNEFNDYLSKPIDMVKLNTVLERWIPKTKQGYSAEINGVGAENANPDSYGISIEGLNVHEGIVLTGGTINSYLQTLAIFYSDALEKIKDIKESLDEDNLSMYATHVHALKSACASIGAKELPEAARALEMAGKKKDFSYIKLHNDKFLANLEELLNNINEKISVDDNEEQIIPTDIELLYGTLNMLKPALDSFDSQVIDDAVSGLREYTRKVDVGHDVECILQNILIGDYDEAVSLVEALLQKLTLSK